MQTTTIPPKHWSRYPHQEKCIFLLLPFPTFFSFYTKKDEKGGKRIKRQWGELLLTFHPFACFSILLLPFFPLISLKKRSGKGPFAHFCSLLINFKYKVRKSWSKWSKVSKSGQKGLFLIFFSKKLRGKKEAKGWKSEQKYEKWAKAHLTVFWSFSLLFPPFLCKRRKRWKKEAKGKCSFPDANHWSPGLNRR